MTTLPAPLTPTDCDLQEFAFMPLHVARLRDSDFAMTEHPEACWYAVLLWSASWHQLPAGSLPDDEMILTRMIGLGRDVKTFRKHRAGAMRGFVKCSDGRLYHPVVAEVATDSWLKKLAQRWRTECARRKKAAQRTKGDYRAPLFEDWLAHNGHGHMVRYVLGTNGECPEDSGDGGEGQPPVRPEDKGTLSLDFSVQEKGREGNRREEIESNHPTTDPETPRAADDPFDAVCSAAGFAPSAKHRDAEQARLEGWLAGWEGVDLVRDVLAPVRQFVLDHPGLTRSLKRFDTVVLDRKARAGGSLTPAAKSAASTPKVSRDGEGAAEAAIRARVSASIGDRTAENWIDPLGLRLNGEALHVTAPSPFFADWATSHFRDVLARCASAEAGRTMRVEIGVGTQPNATTGGENHGQQG